MDFLGIPGWESVMLIGTLVLLAGALAAIVLAAVQLIAIGRRLERHRSRAEHDQDTVAESRLDDQRERG